MTKNKVLVICPSRDRPDALLEMVGSLNATKSEGTDLIIYLNDDDPRLAEYQTEYDEAITIVGKRRFITETYNVLSAAYHYDYYAPINDDHFFITPQWDERLIGVVETKGQGWGCAMADDKLTDWNKHPHPSGCVISGKMIRVLGYMFYPKLHHIGNDVLLGKLLKDIGILFECPEIVIEHRHWVNSCRPMDDNYKWIYGREEQAYGQEAVKKYLFERYEIDKKKLIEAMRIEKIEK